MKMETNLEKQGASLIEHGFYQRIKDVPQHLLNKEENKAILT